MNKGRQDRLRTQITFQNIVKITEEFFNNIGYYRTIFEFELFCQPHIYAQMAKCLLSKKHIPSINKILLSNVDPGIQMYELLIICTQFIADCFANISGNEVSRGNMNQIHNLVLMFLYYSANQQQKKDKTKTNEFLQLNHHLHYAEMFGNLQIDLGEEENVQSESLENKGRSSNGDFEGQIESYEAEEQIVLNRRVQKEYVNPSIDAMFEKSFTSSANKQEMRMFESHIIYNNTFGNNQIQQPNIMKEKIKENKQKQQAQVKKQLKIESLKQKQDVQKSKQPQIRKQPQIKIQTHQKSLVLNKEKQQKVQQVEQKQNPQRKQKENVSKRFKRPSKNSFLNIYKLDISNRGIHKFKNNAIAKALDLITNTEENNKDSKMRLSSTHLKQSVPSSINLKYYKNFENIIQQMNKKSKQKSISEIHYFQTCVPRSSSDAKKQGLSLSRINPKCTTKIAESRSKSVKKISKNKILTDIKCEQKAPAQASAKMLREEKLKTRPKAKGKGKGKAESVIESKKTKQNLK